MIRASTLLSLQSILLALSLLVQPTVFAQNSDGKVSFEQYISDFKVEAMERGFSRSFLDASFDDIQFYQRAVSSDKNQPEFKQTLDTYLPKRLPAWKVNKAIELHQTHAELLAQVSEKYGVQSRFIVALWGVESNFGKLTGGYPVLSALATLAYEGRREALFRKQLYAALTILHEGHIQKADFKGSWAGAMGQSQFMPTSFLNYAQDFDGDGKKDIWNNTQDVFASIANFLATEGWDNTSTWGRQVKLPAGFNYKLTGLKRDKMKPLREWQTLGVRRMDGRDLPERELMASLIMPDDEKGRIYLVYENFHTLMGWNRSTYFGASVGHLADRIKLGR
ncbi:lytic murein transglycosylase [Planctobacterium marinum]|uniref:lytic murein transglycosylase n=1 Tax=Planctobacterium marinum TaxID=1631968 RepID=UPI001E6591A5|nr:lytic murein transglycosylase [Planctobacterium marinum]MCC2607383.1 lytic murein transglycosylase [Planctobacterium marinum]